MAVVKFTLTDPNGWISRHGNAATLVDSCLETARLALCLQRLWNPLQMVVRGRQLEAIEKWRLRIRVLGFAGRQWMFMELLLAWTPVCCRSKAFKLRLAIPFFGFELVW